MFRQKIILLSLLSSIPMPLYPRGGGKSFKKPGRFAVLMYNSPIGFFWAHTCWNALMSFFFRDKMSFSSSDAYISLKFSQITAMKTFMKMKNACGLMYLACISINIKCQKISIFTSMTSSTLCPEWDRSVYLCSRSCIPQLLRIDGQSSTLIIHYFDHARSTSFWITGVFLKPSFF